MKVKLDENLGTAGAEFLKAAGFDVATADRCLITLDKDFSDPLRYPPRNHSGIIVLRLQGRFQLLLLEQALGLVIEAAKEREVRGRLWIAEVDRLREHQERTE